ncbi:hypothetical protein RSOLAG1IB_08702 [Rhizoctonia solani AG-1 IB]|uniref:Uncharacterized protein n=1 Tax=Thanatephorus cucumeris (strain AG1-IB / isolate 7/3/14) TaxID=1108050 RepID=A0A0B7FP12_THACB|nr:hypothetical protein RSOLAG1IB_08702 [Rhizoctonia solani AG-1 IB]
MTQLTQRPNFLKLPPSDISPNRQKAYQAEPRAELHIEPKKKKRDSTHTRRPIRRTHARARKCLQELPHATLFYFASSKLVMREFECAAPLQDSKCGTSC